MVHTGWLPGYEWGCWIKLFNCSLFIGFLDLFCISWTVQGSRHLEFSSEPCEPYPSIQPPRALQTKGWKLRHASLEMRHVGISHHRYVPVIQIQSLPALVVQFKLNYLNLLPPNSWPPGYSGQSTIDFEIWWHVFQMFNTKETSTFRKISSNDSLWPCHPTGCT